jgi:hypothetical protein
MNTLITLRLAVLLLAPAAVAAGEEWERQARPLLKN